MGEKARGETRGEKPGFPLLIVAIRFGLRVLLAIDFNSVEFMCAIFLGARRLNALSGGRFSG